MVAENKLESKIKTVTPTKLYVTKSIKRRGAKEHSETSEEIIQINKFESKPAVAKVGIECKMSMDYQSLGISYAVEWPCYPEEIDEASDTAYAFVHAKITSKIPEIQQTLMDIAGKGK